MSILLRILANLTCLFAALWLFCMSMPPLILTSQYVGGSIFTAMCIIVGVLDVGVVIVAFVAANMLVSEVMS